MSFTRVIKMFSLLNLIMEWNVPVGKPAEFKGKALFERFAPLVELFSRILPGIDREIPDFRTDMSRFPTLLLEGLK